MASPASAPTHDSGTGGPPVAAASLAGVGVKYGPTWALQDVTATIPWGAVGLLGPNGAGKTSMLRALLGLVVPARGRMQVLGLDVAAAPLAIRARVGFMPEADAHIPGMTAVSFVAYCGELAGLPRADAMQRAHDALFYVGLGEARYRTVETYSTGMKQRVKLAQAIVHDPELLFLDEPTNGLDPRGRDEMLDLVRDISRAKGLSLIVSSHLLADIEHTCDHVVVLNQGRIAAQGPIAALKGHAGRVFELRIKADAARTARFLGVLRAEGIDCHDGDGDLMRVFVPAEAGPRLLFDLAARHEVQVRHLRPSVPTLEDVFAHAVEGGQGP